MTPKLKRQACFVCGGHKEITEQHHILDVAIQARNLPSFISAKTVSLCPNCHAYWHLMHCSLSEVKRSSRAFSSLPEQIKHKLSLLNDMHHKEQRAFEYANKEHWNAVS